MTLQEVVKMVEALSPQERVQRLINKIAESIQTGFTDAEWLEIETNMNWEYIEEHDKDMWRD